jgi:N-acetylmuramoyl-L-alanine amidase
MRDERDGRVIVEVSLEASPLGWRAGWRAGRALLEVRPPRPPGAGLGGLVVAIDPGHPPLGSIGPGGLREDSLTLAVGLETARRLRALGAIAVLTRSDRGSVSLDERLARAERAGAEVFVSIHANAPGDGRPPWSVDGTRTYWFQPNALRLANTLHDSVAASLRQPEGGISFSNLAVLRSTWFPAVLVEGLALTMPAREAHLRSLQGVAEYAAGLVAGIRGWAGSGR